MEMQMEWSYVGAVVISGLAIVFVALILLIAAVWVMGRIFTAVKSESPSEYTASSVQEAPPRQIPGQEPHAAKIPEHFKRKGKFLCYQYFGIP